METSNQQVSPDITNSTLSPTAPEDQPSPTVLLETNNRSQLPPNIRGSRSSLCPVQGDQQKWNTFWKNTSHRKLFHKTSDSMLKVKRCESKIWFLSKCLKYNIAPKSCQVNMHHKNSISVKGQEIWSKTSEEAGRMFTTVALAEEKVRLISEREKLFVAEKALYDAAEDDIQLKACVIDKIQCKGRSQCKQENNSHRQRLRNLLAQKDKPVPDSLCETGLSSIHVSQISDYRKSPSKPRKFVKRNKQKKMNRKLNRKMPQLFKNYSEVTITDEEASVLNKGLNFCPMRKKVNKTDVEVAFQRYARSCRWKEFWAGQKEGDISSDECNTGVNDIFRDPTVKTNYPRNHQCPPKLQEHLNAVHVGILGAALKQEDSNLTTGEWDAIRSLREKQSGKEIIIKPNDKTGGCSILKYDSYVSAMKEKLNEVFIETDGREKPKYCRVVEADLKRSWTMTRDLVREGMECGYISEKDAKLMVPDSPKAGRLYGLVKDHKPCNPVTGIPPLREVVSGSGSNTEFISAFVDHHLKQEVKKLDSFVEDSPHFLREIEDRNAKGRLPSNAFPVSMDVVALYPSIPWKEGLDALEKAAERRSEKNVPTIFLMRLMMLVLGANIFEFDNELWIQKYGTAIGTRAAPTLANLFMGEWEKALLEGWKGTMVEFFRRYIDNLFFIWHGTQEELMDFVTFANSILPSINVTVDYDFENRSVNYLDMKVLIDEEGYIRTDLYKKENLKISYLLPSSCHPRHISKNIPYSLAYRLLRICWSRELLDLRLQELSQALQERGYKKRSIEDSFQRVKNITRSTALEKVEKDRTVKERVRFVIKYDPRLPDIQGITRRAWNVLSEDHKMKKVFQEPPIVCYQRVQSLRDMLVKAKLPGKKSGTKTRKDVPGFKPCGDSKCPVCDQLKDKNTIVRTVRCSATGEEVGLKTRLTCSSRNLIYCITCRRGGRTCPTHPQYIGETGKELKERLRGHRGTIIQYSQADTSAPVGVHFRSQGHSICDLEIIPIEKVSGDNMTRKVRESFFIKKFDTVDKGLNLKK